MRILYLFLFVTWFSAGQDGISLSKVVNADFDEDGYEDIAYLTLEKTPTYDTIQMEVYFNGMEGIEFQIKTEKMIFTKSTTNESTEDLICYSFSFQENSLAVIFKKKDITYYWFFNYYNRDFELLHYGESTLENETQKFSYLNLKESKLTISYLKKDATNWDSYSLSHTITNIPTLNQFNGFEVKWPK
jgi:hypothetical protein